MPTVNYLSAPHVPCTPSSPHDYSHPHVYWPHPNPTFSSAPHSQAQAQFQSTEGVESRWMALQALAVTWPPGTIEPFDSTGESPLMAFVDRVERKYHCRVPVEGGLCNKENTKKDRILSHIRKEHLHFRPLACGGHCGFDGWLVNFLQYYTQMRLTCLLASSQQRFPSKSAWTDHVRPRKAKCVWWVLRAFRSPFLNTDDDACSFSGKEMYAQNLKEHKMRACPRRFG